MTVAIESSSIKVMREATDRRARSESDLFYRLRNLLRGMGFDVVKRHSVSDGHLFGDSHTWYLRDRKWRFAVVDQQYAIRNAAKEFNKGYVTFEWRNFQVSDGGQQTAD